MSGGVGRRYEGWRDALIRGLALIEAENDFPDEDLPGALAEQARPAIQQVREDLGVALADAARGQRIRNGFRIALVGLPNAGKSSLLNALVGREAAIVSRQPGTTRDVVEVDLHLEGYVVTLADTAGLRDTSDEVELEGVRRARSWAEQAALRLLLVDPGQVGDVVAFESLVRRATFSFKPSRILSGGIRA
jgi:tRNA modification GTPase